MPTPHNHSEHTSPTWPSSGSAHATAAHAVDAHTEPSDSPRQVPTSGSVHARHAADADGDSRAGEAASHSRAERGSRGDSHDAHASHDKHEGHDPSAFRRLFWVSLVLSIPTVAASEMVQEWLGYSLSAVAGHALIAPVLGAGVFVYGGRVFLKGAWDEIRSRQPGMMLLISLAITVAFGSSVAHEVGLVDLDFWWELAALVTVMLFGHWQEMRALGRTRGALDALADLLPDSAEIVDGEAIRLVPASELRRGDVVLVRPGARVPADGAVESGQADFDESMLTGESRPVLRQQGDRVAAGTVALGSAVRVRVDAVGAETALAGIERLVRQAQESRSRAQAIADRAAALLFYIAVSAGAVTFITWAAVGELDAAITRAVTVLVIACPHALGLAIPLVISISTELAARNGILVKDRLALERTRQLDIVLFDKTGTLTLGRPRLTGLWAADGDQAELLRLAGSVEAESEHPLARAIVESARLRSALVPVSAFVADPGRGVRGTVDGIEVEVVGPRRLLERGVALVDPAGSAAVEVWRARGATVLYVLRDGQIAGSLALEDELRTESREAVRALHGLGVRVAMVTGDARSVAETVSSDLGIDEVFAEVLPEDKAQQVVALQQRGFRVGMVGDGVNDAPALAQADVGIAIGAGTDVAIESAGVVLASDDPRAVARVVRLSAAAYRTMVQNLVWATGYNVVAIPLAAGALAWAGFVPPPAIGAVVMSLSTIIVALNAQLLRRVDI